MDKLEVFSHPDGLDAANTLINAVEAGHVITLQTECSVDYEGRAESTIKSGDRVILIKSDGTVLVHGDTQYRPINWQTEADVTADLSPTDELQIIGKTDEYLEITCHTIYQLSVFDTRDTATLQLERTEEAMHNRIMNDTDIVESGLTNVQNEREFPFGRVDIFGYDDDENTVIIEVKRRPATRDHVYQLYTYVMDYKDQIADENETVRGILVGPKCSSYIHDVLSSRDLEFVQLEP